MKNSITKALILLVSILLLTTCKKDDNSFYEYSSPTFAVYQKPDMPEAIYAYCASHDVYMDSIYVTSPLNIKSRQYFQGAVQYREIYFLVGDNFVSHAGDWQFIFYGRKTINDMAFTVFLETELD